MRHTRATRVVRGALAATVATFVALLSHIAGGASMPGWLGLLAPWLVSLLVCTLLAGRSLSVLRLSIGVAISQVLFHTLFILGTTTGTASAGHDHGQMLFTPIGAPSASAIVTDPVMWLWHGVAAIATTVALHRGERALRRLLDIAQSMRARLIAFVVAVAATPVITARRPAPAASSATVVARATAPFLTTVVRRGPPLAVIH